MFGLRALSSAASLRPVPPPNAKVKDVAAFLGLIRRGCEQYASKFPTWQSLFAMRSKAMEKAGIACQHRKMILRWVQKYRDGIEPYYIPPSLKSRIKAKAKRKAAGGNKK